MKPTYRRGYNAALVAIRREMSGMIAIGRLSAEQVATLQTVEAACREMHQRTRQKPRLAALAGEYRVCLRTIKNWRRAGCPFTDGKMAVLRWMRQRRSIPATARAKFKREFRAIALADSVKAMRRAERARRVKDPVTLYSLSAHVSAATDALAVLEPEELVRRHSKQLLAVAIVARRSGLWDE